jgi:hypothetical protein
MGLSRKMVLKWIRALKSGQYGKGTGKLVSDDGKKFCCLGVWADLHGCTWIERHEAKCEGEGFHDTAYDLIPVLPGKNMPPKYQRSRSFLKKRLAFGLSEAIQEELATVNDDSKGFGKVIKFIEKNILPKAK